MTDDFNLVTNWLLPSPLYGSLHSVGNDACAFSELATQAQRQAIEGVTEPLNRFTAPS